MKLWIRLKVWFLLKYRTEVETVSTPVTVGQLLWEYDQLSDEDKVKMLEWAKDPKNPNPNAIYFYRNVTNFGK